MRYREREREREREDIIRKRMPTIEGECQQCIAVRGEGGVEVRKEGGEGGGEGAKAREGWR